MAIAAGSSSKALADHSSARIYSPNQQLGSGAAVPLEFAPSTLMELDEAHEIAALRHDDPSDKLL